MIIKGLKNIGAYVGVSASTIWRRHYDRRVPFPIAPLRTGRGQGVQWVADTELITLWIQRMGDLKYDTREGRVLRARERRRREKSAKDTRQGIGGIGGNPSTASNGEEKAGFREATGSRSETEEGKKGRTANLGRTAGDPNKEMTWKR